MWGRPEVEVERRRFITTSFFLFALYESFLSLQFSPTLAGNCLSVCDLRERERGITCGHELFHTMVLHR